MGTPFCEGDSAPDPGREAPGPHPPQAREAQPLIPLMSSHARPQGLELMVSGLFIEASR